MSGKTFLLEIATEPLPARFIRPALEQLSRNAAARLAESRLPFASIKSDGTLRRLALLVEGLAQRSEPQAKDVQGPPARLLKNPDGSFTVQAEGFARKQGIEPNRLEIAPSPKGDLIMARLTIPGEPALKILSRVLPELISSLEFPKTLEWEPSRFRFGRPIRALTALYGKSVVPFSLAGIKSGKWVCGLAAEGKKPVALADAGRYAATLKNLAVVVDVGERREILLKRLVQAAKAAGATLDEDPELVEETVFMTEHPVPIAGKFNPEFLSLPEELIAMVLKKQLKFFPLREGRGLKAGFIGVRDGVSEGQNQVREGYERVLTARLGDAAFFLARDLRARLEDKLPLLARVTYQKSLGSMAERAARVGALTGWLAENLKASALVDAQDAAAIARLAFADLVSEVVKEFPELQGTMGGFYARRDGLPERVAEGIAQFYFPAAAGAAIPASAEGRVASLAGKIDGLAGHFAVGNVPSGSADPFALRRQAAGILRIALEAKLPADLDQALEKALSLQPVSLEDSRRAEILRQLSEFLWARAQTLFEEMGYKADEIRSVRAGGLGNLPRTLMRLAAIHGVRKNPEFEPLAAAFKRAANILKQAKGAEGNGFSPKPELLKEPAEIALYEALRDAEGRVREKLEKDGFDEGLRSLVGLKPHVDLFFEKVMVMAEDPELRRQRLGLLATLVRLFNSVADLSQIQQSV